jgi:3',5'-cyclic AMP phosphodiesterase CpdA
MKIMHLSDLHFGRESENLLPAFMRILESVGPDLVIVSGDFTQHASPVEFAKAAAFLKSLPCPFFAVPGNHDITGTNLWERFLFPYRRYRGFVSPELCPVASFPDALVIGINSVRRFMFHWNWANGAVGRKQLCLIARAFVPEDPRWKICVLHHPIHRMEDAPIPVRVSGATRALQAIHDSKVDLVLTGHVHQASITQLGDAVHKTIYLNASTALSTRVRMQGNGFNLITLDETHLEIAVYHYQNCAFSVAERFERTRM